MQTYRMRSSYGAIGGEISGQTAVLDSGGWKVFNVNGVIYCQSATTNFKLDRDLEIQGEHLSFFDKQTISPSFLSPTLL